MVPGRGARVQAPGEDPVAASVLGEVTGLFKSAVDKELGVAFAKAPNFSRKHGRHVVALAFIAGCGKLPKVLTAQGLGCIATDVR